MFIGILLGSLVGALLGLTGAGGGVLAVPALMLGLGLSMTDAVPVALIAVGGAAWLGGLAGLRQGLVRYKAALLMAVLGTVCAPAGVWLAHRLPASVVPPALLVALAWLARTLFRSGDFDLQLRCLRSRRWRLRRYRCRARLRFALGPHVDRRC
jgi:uncharacterized protein